MAEVEGYVLEIEDFVREKRPDGLVVLTHPFLEGTIEWNSSTEPVPFLFRKLKDFSEKNGVLLSSKIAKAYNYFEEGLEQAGREPDYEEDFTD